MKRITWRKHHKWFGLLFCFFMLMFCWSGIVLNHREAVADINVSRKWLPAGYRFEAWNGGLLRGTLRYTDKDSVAHILAYGAAGVWRTDTAASAFADFNEGLSQGADYRSMKGIVQTPDAGSPVPHGACLLAAAQGHAPPPPPRAAHGRRSPMDTPLPAVARQAGTHHYHTDPLGGRYGLVSPSTRHDTVGSD